MTSPPELKALFCDKYPRDSHAQQGLLGEKKDSVHGDGLLAEYVYTPIVVYSRGESVSVAALICGKLISRPKPFISQNDLKKV